MINNKNSWFRYSINHAGCGNSHWFYLFGPEWWAKEATEEYYENTMPDSHKWRGAKFEKVPANKVPRKVREKRDADYRKRSLCAAAEDMHKALSKIVKTGNICNEAYDALAKANAKPTYLFWSNLYDV